MCRFMIYKSSEPIRLEHLLTRPAHSIINQSFDSRLRIDMRRPINGDGFGVGYYPEDMDVDEEKGPCVYCATTPAWNNMNLARLASKTKSRLVFAHVRASTAGVLAETNCHPFVYHTLMFMHNGGVLLFDHVKRRMCDAIDNKHFIFIQGSTDSEICFAVFLDTLDKMGYDPASPEGNFPADALTTAIQKTLEKINNWTKEAAEELGLAKAEPSLLNFAVTDGNTVVVSRYISSSTDEAASLYYSTGTRFYEYAQGQYRMERCYRLNNIVMVASEPLTFERSDWIAIPTNTILTIKGQTVLMYPIKDEYYNPTVQRSTDLMVSKGLASPLVANNPSNGVPPMGPEGRTFDSNLVAVAAAE